MKKLLTILSVFIVTSSTVSMIPKINTTDNSEFYRSFTWRINHDLIKQENPNYNLVANLQGIMKVFNGKVPLQSNLQDEFDQLRITKSLQESVTELLNRYVYKKDKKYVSTGIPSWFGRTNANKQFFQSAILDQLTLQTPVLLYINASDLPWWNPNTGKDPWIFVTIYGIHTPDVNNPIGATYEVIDTVSGEGDTKNYLNAINLERLTSKGSAFIWSATDKFDFFEETVTIKPDIRQANYNKVVDRDETEIYISQTVSIWDKLGMLSFDIFKKFVNYIELTQSYTFYQLGDKEFDFSGESYSIDIDAPDEGDWEERSETSLVWDIGSSNSLWITDYTKYKFTTDSFDYWLQFSHKIDWRKVGAFPDLPYIGVSMGAQWIIHWA